MVVKKRKKKKKKKEMKNGNKYVQNIYILRERETDSIETMHRILCKCA